MKQILLSVLLFCGVFTGVIAGQSRGLTLSVDIQNVPVLALKDMNEVADLQVGNPDGMPAVIEAVTVDLSSLSEGDTAGLAILQGKYAYVGITRRNDGYHAVMYSEDKEIESFAIGENEIRLRAECDFEDGRDEVRFLIDAGDGFKAIGDVHKMQFTLDHFTGARFALFVMSEKTVGGQAAFSDFRYFR